MKILHKKLTTLLTVLILGNGLVAQVDKKIFEGVFTELRVIGKIDVELIPHHSNQVEFGGNADMEKVTVEFKSERLILKTLKGFSGKEHFKAKVRYKVLEKISIDAGAAVYSHEKLGFTDSEFKVNTGASLETKIDGNNITIEVGQGAVVGLQGEIKTLKVNANTGGRFDCEKLNANTTNASANTGGYIIIRKTEKLEANANTGGVIEYLYEPEKIKVKTSLGGKVKKAHKQEP